MPVLMSERLKERRLEMFEGGPEPKIPWYRKLRYKFMNWKYDVITRVIDKLEDWR
jgi:hypothetical protein